MLYQTNITNLSSEELELVKQTYHLRKSLLCFTLIDLVINILNGVSIVNTSYYWINFILGLFIIFGMLGINKYNETQSKCYYIYLGLQIIGRLVFLLNIITNTLNFILNILLIFINVWIMKFLCTFVNNIKKLSEYDLEQLKSGWDGNQQIIIHTI